MNLPKTTARDLPPRMLRRVRTLAERIRRFQFRDIRPKAASELPVEHASRLLGHSEKEITERVYRRLGEVVKPTKRKNSRQLGPPCALSQVDCQTENQT